MAAQLTGMQYINGILVDGISIGSLYAMIATGFNIIWKSIRILNLAQGDLMMWCPLAILLYRQVWGWPLGLAIFAGLVTPMALGFILSVFAIEPYVTRPTENAWLLSTLGASVILEQLGAQPLNGASEAFNYGASGRLLRIGGLMITPQYLVMIGAAVLLYVGTLSLFRTKLGRRLIAVGEDPDGARALGISPVRMARFAVVSSALAASIAGIAFGPLTLVSPYAGLGYVFSGFVAVAIGGLGSITGGLIGGMLVGIITQVTAVFAGSTWTDAALFGSLLVVYLVKPTGLFGSTQIRTV